MAGHLSCALTHFALHCTSAEDRVHHGGPNLGRGSAYSLQSGVCHVDRTSLKAGSPAATSLPVTTGLPLYLAPAHVLGGGICPLTRSVAQEPHRSQVVDSISRAART